MVSPLEKNTKEPSQVGEAEFIPVDDLWRALRSCVPDRDHLGWVGRQ